ncbi:MAG: alginate export family protein [Verrucomicrobia bacterium]|nr:alginate export family protein [Verrucomicrobiota bacterium]
MKTNANPLHQGTLTFALIFLLACLNGKAQEGKRVSEFIKRDIPDTIENGKVLLEINPRYEFVDQDGLEEANAFTVRTALGFKTGKLYGFSGLFEAEDVTIIGNEDNFNQAGLNPGGAGKAIVADPESTEVNRVWLGYDNWDTKLKLGRQRIIMDNARFVGNVGWRQNEQTFDGLSLNNKSLEHFDFSYGYVYNVNRIFGDDHPAGDFDSDSHILHGSYDGLSFGKVTAYGYLLDFKNDSPINSSDTFGASFVGKTPIAGDWSAKYHAEYAYQTDGGDNPIDYEASYLHLDAGAIYKEFDVGGGMEMLGSDDGNIGFSTPLATLHGFNGWADLFLATPPDGLIDTYVYSGVTMPYNIPFRVFYHEFESDSGDTDYGHEIDAIVTKKIGKNWNLLTKYAFYEGNLPDRQKLWLQVTFSF